MCVTNGIPLGCSLIVPVATVNCVQILEGTDDVPSSRLTSLIEKSYSTFSSKHVVPLVKVSDKLCIMEQFHGPTCAFKDVALQFLGNMFEHFLQSENAGVEQHKHKRITILGTVRFFFQIFYRELQREQ
jgi:threonine synthase